MLRGKGNKQAKGKTGGAPVRAGKGGPGRGNSSPGRGVTMAKGAERTITEKIIAASKMKVRWGRARTKFAGSQVSVFDPDEGLDVTIGTLRAVNSRQGTSGGRKG